MSTQPTQQQLLALWDAVQKIESKVNYEDPKGMFDHMDDFVRLLSMVPTNPEYRYKYLSDMGYDHQEIKDVMLNDLKYKNSDCFNEY